MSRLLPGEKVTDYSVEYAGMTLFDRATVVTDAAEAGVIPGKRLSLL